MFAGALKWYFRWLKYQCKETTPTNRFACEILHGYFLIWALTALPSKNAKLCTDFLLYSISFRCPFRFSVLAFPCTTKLSTLNTLVSARRYKLTSHCVCMCIHAMLRWGILWYKGDWSFCGNQILVSQQKLKKDCWQQFNHQGSLHYNYILNRPRVHALKGRTLKTKTETENGISELLCTS